MWRFIGADWVGSSPALAPELGLLFIGLEFAVEGKRGSIVALKLENGEKVWEHMTKRYTHASPAYWPERHLVACGSNDDEMFLFDAGSGAMRWRFETRGSIRHAPAFDVARGHLITGCADRVPSISSTSRRERKYGLCGRTIPFILFRWWSTTRGISVRPTSICTFWIWSGGWFGRKSMPVPKSFRRRGCWPGGFISGACSGMVYELDPATAEITGTHQLPDAVTNALAYNAETGDFYALTYVNQLFAFTRVH